MARGTGSTHNQQSARGSRRGWALATALRQSGVGEAAAVRDALHANDVEALLAQLVDPAIAARNLQLLALRLVDALWQGDIPDYVAADSALASAIIDAGYPDVAVAAPLTLLATTRLAAAYDVSIAEFSSALAQKRAALPDTLKARLAIT